jgi:3-mercaptopyruvate sulfurtransferase SseA
LVFRALWYLRLHGLKTAELMGNGREKFLEAANVYHTNKQQQAVEESKTRRGAPPAYDITKNGQLAITETAVTNTGQRYHVLSRVLSEVHNAASARLFGSPT